MIRLSALILALLVSASMLSAATVRVRSGEHDDFTRLVIPLPPGSAWSLQSAATSARVVIDAPEIRYDTSNVFQRVPRTRLRTLAQADAGAPLILGLACRCQVTAFEQDNAFLVIDIAAERNTDAVMPEINLPTNLSPYRFSDGGRAGPPERSERAQTSPERNAPPQASPEGSVAALDLIVPALSDRTSTNAWERRLSNQIRLAAGLGILAPSKEAREAGTAKAAWPSTTAKPPESGQKSPADNVANRSDAPPEPKVSPSPNLAISTASGLASTWPQGRKGGAIEKPRCLDGKLVDVPAWGGSADFFTRIGSLRNRLFTERDRVSPSAATDLAKVYLYYGFGAEARQVLSLVPGDTQQKRVFSALASIMDRSQDTSGTLLNQAGCGGDLSMWAVLASPIGSRSVNSDEVQQAFGRLPVHLRRQLGPPLAARFVDIGESGTAQAILRAIDRSGNGTSVDEKMVQADLADLHDDPVTAEVQRTEVLKSSTEDAPRALVDLVERSWERRLTVTPDLPDLAGSYSLEYRNSPLGLRLQRAHAVSLALAGRFDEAVRTASVSGAGPGAQAVTGARVPVLTLLTERGDDITFLRHFLTLSNSESRALPPELIDKAARRLLDLGMINDAERLLDDGQAQPSDARHRMLAEIALERGRPQSALTHLLGLSDPKSAQLRATALLREGDRREAATMFLKASDKENALRSAWLSGGKTTDLPATGGVYDRVAKVSRQLGPEPDAQPRLPPLASARAALEQSGATRASVADLLDAVGEVPPM